MAEQRTLNPQVQGSNPWGRTTKPQVRRLTRSGLDPRSRGDPASIEEYDSEAFKTINHIVTSRGIGRSAWFKDPDGNTIALFQPE